MKVYDLTAGAEFTHNDVLVMGSDGLWERFQNNDVSSFFLKQRGTFIPASCPVSVESPLSATIFLLHPSLLARSDVSLITSNQLIL